MNKLQKIICFIGGANLKVLEKCPNDKNKFISVGIGVFNSAVMSMCTMGYAMYSVNNQSMNWLIVLFAVFWGFVLFGIDWGLVTTIHKKEKYTAKTRSVFWTTAFFRLLVAIALSFTISKPLEVLVFKDYLPMARRDLQIDYQQTRNKPLEQDEDRARSILHNTEQQLANIPQERQNIYNQDSKLQQLIREEEQRQTAYEQRRTQYEPLNITSHQRVSTAQSQINEINRNITDIRQIGNLTAIQQQQQIANLENSRQQQARIQDTENANIRSRNDRLAELNRQFTSKRNERIDRQQVLDADIDDRATVLREQAARLTADKDSIFARTTAERARNEDASSPLDISSLINDIIAIQFIERWRDDPNASIGEQKIARAVSFTRWLLMIVIMIVDTAPVVIKLLQPRGNYEEEKEKMKDVNSILRKAELAEKEKARKEKIIQCEADLTHYPNFANAISRIETRLKELNAQKDAEQNESNILQKAEENRLNTVVKSRENFNITIAKMIKKSSDEIHEVNEMHKSVAKTHDNQKLKEIFIDYCEKMSEQLELTKNKMFEIHDEFIRSIKP